MYVHTLDNMNLGVCRAYSIVEQTPRPQLTVIQERQCQDTCISNAVRVQRENNGPAKQLQTLMAWGAFSGALGSEATLLLEKKRP